MFTFIAFPCLSHGASTHRILTPPLFRTSTLSFPLKHARRHTEKCHHDARRHAIVSEVQCTGRPLVNRRFYLSKAMAASICLLNGGLLSAPASIAAEERVTNTVYFDVQVGDEPEVGRIVIGLFGDRAPNIVQGFYRLATAQTGAGYKGSVFHRVVKGRYIEGGHIRQLTTDVQTKGRPPPFSEDEEFLSSKSFELKHDRPGILTTGTSYNDIDSSGFEFVITVAPLPELDGSNIVFGKVLKGQDLITSISEVPILRPSKTKQFFLDFGEAIGDERAQLARASLNRPLSKVRIINCGDASLLSK
mmetsp:Transcript_46223/g.76995  ORF Transcript_46223/g.76995 Transcript_46223/m.76995 type:complete len:304 (-) Transcript_46223:350-1261(-)